jgi:hypothetical protein
MDSTTSGSAIGDVLAGAVAACTTVGALFEASFWEFPEQPKMVNRMPVETNKKTFFIIVSLQRVRLGRGLNVVEFGVLSANLE